MLCDKNLKENIMSSWYVFHLKMSVQKKVEKSSNIPLWVPAHVAKSFDFLIIFTLNYFGQSTSKNVGNLAPNLGRDLLGNSKNHFELKQACLNSFPATVWQGPTTTKSEFPFLYHIFCLIWCLWEREIEIERQRDDSQKPFLASDDKKLDKKYVLMFNR